MNYKPVPKVLAQSLTGLVTALVVAGLAWSGVGEDQAGEVGAAVAALVVAGLPVVIGFIGGWLKTDTERAQLIERLKLLEGVVGQAQEPEQRGG